MKRGVLIQFRKIHCNFIKNETLAQVFSCEFCKISKNNSFTEHLWTTACGITRILFGSVENEKM